MKKKESVIYIEDIAVTVERKNIRSIRLRICPPDGVVKLSAPYPAPEETLKRFVSSRLEWIRKSIQTVKNQSATQSTATENGEDFFMWGQCYSLVVNEQGNRYQLKFTDGDAVFTVPATGKPERRKAYLNDFYRQILTERVRTVLPVWEKQMGLYASGFSVRDMTSRWGSCNTGTGHIILNLQLAKRPEECLTYVIVHELAHLKVPAHNADFYAILDTHMPNWRQIKKRLNAPLSTEAQQENS